jgi:hypothetical protein
MFILSQIYVKVKQNGGKNNKMIACDCICHVDGRRCPVPGGCCTIAENSRPILPSTKEKTIKAKISFSGQETPRIANN